MEENKNREEELQYRRDKFKMDPPGNAWNQLDAELERKQGLMYRQRGNRFKLLSIGLAFLLFSFVTYYYISSDKVNSNHIVGINGKSPARSSENHSSSFQLPASGIENNHVSKRGLGTRDNGYSSVVPRSSSALNNKPSFVKIINNESKVSSAVTENGKNQINENKDEGTQASSEEAPQVLKTPDDAQSDAAPQISKTPENIPGDADNDDSKGAAASQNGAPSDSQNQKSFEDHPLQASSESTNTENSKSPVPPPVDSGKKMSPWSIEAFYSPNYYSKNHLTNNNASYGDYANDYSSREKATYSFASGIAIRYDLTNNWSLSAGGTYSTIAYSITLPALYANYGSDNQLHYMYPTSCGNIEMPNTSNKNLNYGDSLNASAACSQVITFISIPVSLRYRLGEGRLRPFTDAGVSFNFVAEEKANITIGTTETTIFNNIDGLKKMNYGYLLGVGIEYGFYNNLNIYIEPEFRGSLNSLTENMPFYCYPNAFNVNMGLLYHF